MLSTFDALARDVAEEDNNEVENNMSVDMSAIINRLNELETKVNEILNKTTEPVQNDVPQPQEREITETETETESEE